LFVFFQHTQQEKHRLKQQLQLMEDEYEQRLQELQSDIHSLQSSLNEANCNSKLNERQKLNLISQLTEQNQRLTSELQDSVAREAELQGRIDQLRSQVMDKRITVQDHVTHLEILGDEIDLLTRRKNELGKKVEQLIDERERLTVTLDEASDKTIVLEKRSREQDYQVRSSFFEIFENLTLIFLAQN
jgi:chromosome segregation ATPase